jgi:hypothetical protein
VFCAKNTTPVAYTSSNNEDPALWQTLYTTRYELYEEEDRKSDIGCNVSSHFINLLKRGDGSDCDLVSNDDSVHKVHSVVLLRSPVFAGNLHWLSNDTKSSAAATPHARKSIRVDLSNHATAAVVSYLYSDSFSHCDAITDYAVAEEIVFAADSYLLPKMTILALAKLTELTTVKTFADGCRTLAMLKQEEPANTSLLKQRLRYLLATNADQLIDEFGSGVVVDATAAGTSKSASARCNVRKTPPPLPLDVPDEDTSAEKAAKRIKPTPL